MINKEYVEKRKLHLIKMLVSLYQENKLTEKEANGIAGAINELNKLDKTIEDVLKNNPPVF